MSTIVRKIIVDSRAFLNNAPAQSGTFELPEIIELYGNEALYLQPFSLRGLVAQRRCDEQHNVRHGVGCK